MHDENDPAYIAYCEEREAEHMSVQINGFEQCEKCGEYSMLATSVPTRQYGGGFNTIYQCANPECQHQDICV